MTALRSTALHRGASLCLLVTAFASTAHAEEPAAADVASARSLGQEGVKLADAGNCQDAIDKLARSERLFHAPTTLARLGECQIQVGKIVDGTESLNKVVRETLAPGAPNAFGQAQERARRVLAEAKPKIAKLKIAVAAPPDVALSVKVDGEPMPPANLNTNRPMDPGEHVIEATAPGYKIARGKVSLAEGGSDTVALTLEVDPDAPKAPLAAATTTRTDTTDAKRSLASSPGSAQAEPSRIPAYVALGVGVAGLAVGGIFGGLALRKKGDLNDNCLNGVCGSGQKSNLDDGKTFGTVSTVGFIVGGVGVVAGIVMLATGWPKKTTTTGLAAPRKAGPFVSVDHVGLVF